MTILEKIIDSTLVTEDIKKKIIYYILNLDLNPSQIDVFLNIYFEHEEYKFLYDLEFCYSDLKSITKEELFLHLLSTKCREEVKLSQIVLNSFIWGDTKQGYSFWEEMYDFIELKEKKL